MKFFKFQPGFILTLFFLSLILADPLIAKAYIDPGTGSFIVQAVIAFVALGALYTKLFWKKIGSLFRYFLSKYQNEKAKSAQSNEHKQQH